MPEDPDEIMLRLQTQADHERKQAIEIQLGDLGPYRLPRCTDSQGILVMDQETLGLWLVTERGQRVLVPISGPAAVRLSTLLDLTLKRLRPQDR